MPIFTYNCADCSAQFDIITQSSSQEVECTNCKSTNTKRLIGNVSGGVGCEKAKKYVKDRIAEEQHKRADLLNNYGVASVGNVVGSQFDHVYDEIKSQGDLVKSQMIESKEKAHKQRDERMAKIKEKNQDNVKKALERRKS